MWQSPHRASQASHVSDAPRASALQQTPKQIEQRCSYASGTGTLDPETPDIRPSDASLLQIVEIQRPLFPRIGDTFLSCHDTSPAICPGDGWGGGETTGDTDAWRESGLVWFGPTASEVLTESARWITPSHERERERGSRRVCLLGLPHLVSGPRVVHARIHTSAYVRLPRAGDPSSPGGRLEGTLRLRLLLAAGGRSREALDKS